MALTHDDRVTLSLLKQAAPELALRVESAGNSHLRRLTTAIVAAAVESSGLSNPLIAEALASLKTSEPLDAELRARVAALTGELDSVYFDLSEPFEERDEDPNKDPQVITAFRKARAAASVAAALAEDPRAAAIHAAYEATFAADDTQPLVSATDAVS